MQIAKKNLLQAKKKVQKFPESTSTNWCREDPAIGLNTANQRNQCQLCQGAGCGDEAEAALPKLELTVPIRVNPKNADTVEFFAVMLCRIHCIQKVCLLLEKKQNLL